VSDISQIQNIQKETFQTQHIKSYH